MFGVDKLQRIVKACLVSLITGFLVLSLTSCGNSLPDSFGSRLPGEGNGLRAATPADSGSTSRDQLAGTFSEVSPPEVIQQLRQALETYQPQVKILSPQSDEVLQDNRVTAQFQVQNLPIFKNSELDLGPHLHVILDNQPYIAIYDLKAPLVLPDLAPGTHTLRVFASRPWNESFKNEGAYAQTTFHIFTKTDDNKPDANQPLLTYSSPGGSYGAEPILLDFYLTNAPLHLVAQENPQDEIADWRIRCTINGNSFVLDRWEPIYLKGFKPGKNWVQLEFLDEQANPIKNVFNNTVRVITYEPKGKDTLSRLTRGELSTDAARGIVEPNYTAIKQTKPTPIPAPPVPTATPIPTPSAEETSPTAQPSEEKPLETEIETKDSVPTIKEESKPKENQKANGFFNRLRRPEAQPSPTIPEVIDSPAPESITPNGNFPQPEIPEPQPLVTPTEPAPLDNPDSEELKLPTKEKLGGYFNRYRRPQAIPSPDLTPIPEIVEPLEAIPH